MTPKKLWGSRPKPSGEFRPLEGCDCSACRIYRRWWAQRKPGRPFHLTKSELESWRRENP